MALSLTSYMLFFTFGKIRFPITQGCLASPEILGRFQEEDLSCSLAWGAVRMWVCVSPRWVQACRHTAKARTSCSGMCHTCTTRQKCILASEVGGNESTQMLDSQRFSTRFAVVSASYDCTWVCYFASLLGRLLETSIFWLWKGPTSGALPTLENGVKIVEPLEIITCRKYYFSALL